MQSSVPKTKRSAAARRAGSALTGLIGGARAAPERPEERMLNSVDRTDGRRPSEH